MSELAGMAMAGLDSSMTSRRLLVLVPVGSLDDLQHGPHLAASTPTRGSPWPSRGGPAQAQAFCVALVALRDHWVIGASGQRADFLPARCP